VIPKMSLYLFLSLFVLSLCLGVTVSDTPCKVDGNAYLCMSIATTLDRWGVEYRSYDRMQWVGFIPNGAPLNGSPTQAITTALPLLNNYFNGGNNNNTQIPVTRPVAVQTVTINMNNTLAVPFFFLPATVIGSPPAPVNTNVVFTAILPKTDVIVLTLTGSTDDAISAALVSLKQILDQHKQNYNPYGSFYVTYMTADTKTYPNEVWVYPEDSELAKETLRLSSFFMKHTGEKAEKI